MIPKGRAPNPNRKRDRQELEVQKMYKMRFYKKAGADEGNLDHEEFFDTREQVEARYKEVYVEKDLLLNPTVWEDRNGEWRRISL